MATCFAPYVAATREPVALSMQRLWLAGRIGPAGARLTVQHVFRSEEAKPIEVVYAFSLPRDAALRAFRITGQGFEVDSDLRPVEEAVKRYEEGLAQGSLSALARNYGDGLVNLTVGNVRPGETVNVFLDVMAGVEPRDDGFRFRFPFTVAPCYHPRIRSAVTDGEGELELPPDTFGDVMLPRFRKDASGLHEAGFDLAVSGTLPVDEIGSPSHAIRMKDGGRRVMLAPASDVPDRDLVLDVRYSEVKPQVLAGPAGGSRHFAAVIPSTAFGERRSVPRRVAFLLDRSGSMGGRPIEQAHQALNACLAVLTPEDHFALVGFDDKVETMPGGLHRGDWESRQRAALFLKAMTARGGTELAQGFEAAARLLDGGGDVFVLTDGQVFGTEEILAKARSTGVRISCLGIGAASQDRFITLLARETGGVSRFATLRERVDLAAVDLFASTGNPVASGLKADDGVSPEPPLQVFQGTPVLLFGTTEKETFDLTWDGGSLSLPVPAGDPDTGQTVRLLRGSRLITDWESRYPAEDARAPIERRKQTRVAARLVELSKEYGLASREVALVAVVKRTGDRPDVLPETRVVPVGLPEGMTFDAFDYGMDLRGRVACAAMASPLSMPAAAAPVNPPDSGGAPQHARPRLQLAWFGRRRPVSSDAVAGAPPAQEPVDELMRMASQLRPDGGMPGRDPAARLKATAEAVIQFVKAGHTLTEGAFRSHVARLVAFLKSLDNLTAEERKLVDRAVSAATTGRVP